MSTTRFTLLLAFVSVFGCAASSHATTADEQDTQSPTDEAVTKKLPAPAVATQRLYFPNTSKSLPYGGGAMAWPYPASGEHVATSAWVFAAKGGTRFSVSVTGYDDGEGLPAAPMSLTVYYLSGGKWKFADSASTKGLAKISLSPTYDHQWLVVAKGDVGGDGNNLEIALGCDDGVDAGGHSVCALAQEPGDACGTKGNTCDTGLICDRCGAKSGAGTCATSNAPPCTH